MSHWTVELRPPAKRELRGLGEGPKRDALELIADLEDDPGILPSLELCANPRVYRVRFHHGLYRMIYRISPAQRKIMVLRIRPRGNAYQGLKD